MIYHDKVVAFLTLYVATAASHSPHLGQRIHQDAPLLTIKDYAERVLQERGSSLKRQDSVGSWALRATTCPQNTQECDGGFPAMAACCPKDLVCVASLFRIACCLTSAKCDTTASTFPKCGDSSWTLWAGGHDRFFCCQSGEIGYITTENSGACGPDNLNPTGTQVATSLVQAGGEDQPPQTSDPTIHPDGNPREPGDDSNNPTDTSSPVTSSFGTTDNSPTNPPGASRTSDNRNGDSDESSNPTNSSSSSESSNPTNSPPSSESSGLPTGAIVGIAAGAVVILILAGVAIYFALKAGKKKGAAEAMAAFQQQQRSLPGGDIHQSGPTTPGAVVPPMSPPLPRQGYGQQTHLKPDGTSLTAEKYGEAVPPSGPPPQWSASADPQGGPRYEADATNTYPGATYAEMEGYNNNQRRY